MFAVIVLKSTNPTQPTSFDEKATLEPNELSLNKQCEAHGYRTHKNFHPNVVGYSLTYTQVFIKFPVSLNFSLKIDSNPQPMSYFRPLEEVGCETSMAIEFIKLCNPISLVTCSRRDKCLFNFQHHWNAVHRVRPRSSELCNWMPYSVGLLHIVCTPYIYIHTYI